MSRQARLARLTQPLVRVDGGLRPASWDEALDRAAAGFAVARDRDATASFGMFRLLQGDDLRPRIRPVM